MDAPIPEKTTIRSPEGHLFHVSFENGALWVHAEGAGGQGVAIDRYEPNAGNEGWLRYRSRPAIVSQPLQLARRASR